MNNLSSQADSALASRLTQSSRPHYPAILRKVTADGFAATTALRYLAQMPTDLLLVYCTCPDSESAQTIARQLIEQRAAACVNALPGVSSTYLWQEKLETSEEILLLIKSSNKQYPEIERIIVSLHPYELPEIIAVDVERGLPDYLHWVKQCTETTT